MPLYRCCRVCAAVPKSSSVANKSACDRVRCRRCKEREAVFALDDGLAPPLSPLGPPAGPWGRLQGTEALAASALPAWKATAVRRTQRTGVTCYFIRC